MHRPVSVSLLRIRTRMAHAPWRMRLLAAWVVLSLTFAFTPCCDVIGMANAATGHDHGVDAHGGAHAPDSGDPCATWLDRSDVVPPKADDASTPGAKMALATPFISHPSASSVATMWRPFRLSAPPPDPLYLRHARLIL